VEPREVDDHVIGAIERRADERVHAGLDPHPGDLALALDLGDAGQEDARLGHQEASGLEPELVAGVGGLAAAEAQGDLREVEGRLTWSLWDPEAAAGGRHAHP